MALKDTETARILKRGIPTKDKSFISSFGIIKDGLKRNK